MKSTILFLLFPLILFQVVSNSDGAQSIPSFESSELFVKFLSSETEYDSNHRKDPVLNSEETVSQRVSEDLTECVSTNT